MKTEPTDLDREAAGLFNPSPGMRVWFHHDGSPSRVVGEKRAQWERGGYPFQVEVDGPLGLDAIDTDDPATVGCMLAQVEEAGRQSGHLARFDENRWQDCDVLFSDNTGETVIDNGVDGSFRFVGPTRGAALVAAIKGLRK